MSKDPLYYNLSLINGYNTSQSLSPSIIEELNNQLIVDNQVLGSDYLDCSGQSINLLNFRLCDAFGQTIDLNGNHWSFNIIFSKVSEEN